MSDGSLAVDTDVPAGGVFDGGVRLNSTGAMYGTTTVAATDLWVRSVRISALGQLVYEVAAPTGFNSGNPITATGALATT